MRVSALTGSVPRKTAEGWQRVSVLIRNRTHVVWPDFLLLTLTTKLWVRVNYIKSCIWLIIFCHLQPILCIQDCHSWIVQNVYQGQTRNTRILDANLWSIHLIAFCIDWSWNIFTLHNFCLLLVEQLIDLENVRTENLKFRTDLHYGWLASNTVDDCLQWQIAGKIFK